MITAAQIVEKIKNEKEESRLSRVNKVISLLEKAAETMLKKSAYYFRFHDLGESESIELSKNEPEVKEWLEKTGFFLRRNISSGAVDLFIPLP